MNVNTALIIANIYIASISDNILLNIIIGLLWLAFATLMFVNKEK